MNYYDRPEVKAQRLQASIWNRESLDKMKERYPGQKCTIKRKTNGTVEIYFNHKHKVSFMCLATEKDIIAWKENKEGNVFIDRLKEPNNLIRSNTMATKTATKKVAKKEVKKTVEKQMKEIKEDVNSLITKLNKESDRNSSTARSLRKKIRSLGHYLSKNKPAAEKVVKKEKKAAKKVEKKKVVKKAVKKAVKK